MNVRDAYWPLVKLQISERGNSSAHDAVDHASARVIPNRSDAERLYSALAVERPRSRSVAWRLGLAQLENNHSALSLASFDRAKSLGQGGARDFGLPATRAALRAANRTRAVEWLKWALTSYPRIRAEVAADAELAPLLSEVGGDR